VDSIFHSDSLYSAVASAMARLGSLDEWLAQTARASAPAVSFSSCFPFLDEIGFVVPPRTIWPPVAPALLAARVRWKSARFVPLTVVQAMLAGRRLDEQHWSVDGPSQCLVPAGRPGPFRIDTRFNAAVDRLTGVSERHATACLEFRPGAGFWTVVSFLGDDARERWLDPVKAAFRLLADTGFGGERSLGWGRSEQPEFETGVLPDLIVPEPPRAPLPPAPPTQAAVHKPTALELLREYKSAGSETAAPAASTPGPVAKPEPSAPEPSSDSESAAEPAPSAPETAAPAPSAASEPAPPDPEIVPAPAPKPAPLPAPKRAETGYWLLSVFSPAPDDAIDWQRGSYTLAERGGRIDSPARAGDAKKILRMVEEGSVLVAPSAPRGAAPDVAPDGFPHPVFRCGFALAVAIPLRGDR
jgi:CRISPR/Cas system CSM-associated protein Csm4 (group 5 of RAMP superfamily)